VIIGIGVDLVGIDRFRSLAERTDGLLERLFRDEELRGPSGRRPGWPSLAAAFALKEAALKAVGVPHGFTWHDLEVSVGGSGGPSPRIVLRGATAAAAARLGVAAWRLGTTRRAGHAIATAIAESVV